MQCSVDFLTVYSESTFAIHDLSKNNCYRSTTLLSGLGWTIVIIRLLKTNVLSFKYLINSASVISLGHVENEA